MDKEYMVEVNIIRVDGQNMDDWQKVSALTESIQSDTLAHDVKELAANVKKAIEADVKK